MEIFPPHALPGTGLGDIASVVGFGGLAGIACAAGMLVAEGIVGVIAFVAATSLVLASAADAFGGRPAPLGAALVLVVVLAALRAYRSRTAPPGEEPGNVVVSLLDALAVLASAATVGTVWSEWNELPFSLDTEAAVGMVAAVLCGAAGAAAARAFVSGSVRAGGSHAIVGGVVAVVAIGLGALAGYVPFAGFAVVVLAVVFVVRLRRQSGRKYKGLRILSG